MNPGALIPLLTALACMARAEPLTVRWGFTASNTGGTPLGSDAVLWAALPRSDAAGLRCERVTCSHAAERVVEPGGNVVLRVPLDGLAPYGQRIVTIECALTRSMDRPAGFPPADAGTAGLAAQPEPASVASRARAVFDRLRGTLRNDGYHRRDRGAAWALEHGRGDCTEFAAVLADALRAERFPARRVSGYRCARSMRLAPAGLHTWTEFHDGLRWRAADLTDGTFDPPADGLIVFRAGAYAALFRFTGRNLRVRMNP
jgi:hypothetical protein